MRTVEVYTGAYASGKSENALNRAIEFRKENKEITLVDLDTVEPAYCLRPIENKLKGYGINVILQSDYFGLGEAGSYVTNAQINCLKQTQGDIIIDVGYGVYGLDTLDILNGIDEEENLKIYLVVNTSKFETKDKDSIIEYVNFNSGNNNKPWKKLTGLISNTHLSDETTLDDIIRGYNILKEAACELSLPIAAISVDEKFKSEFIKLGSNAFQGAFNDVSVRFLNRHMPEALW